MIVILLVNARSLHGSCHGEHTDWCYIELGVCSWFKTDGVSEQHVIGLPTFVVRLDAHCDDELNIVRG